MEIPVKYMPEDKPGQWKEGTLERGTVEEHPSLVSYTTADVRDEEGKLHEQVTIIDPGKR